MQIDVGISEPKPCTGCGACIAVCKEQAISFSINDEGFYEPRIDQTKCRDCSACRNVCYRYKAIDILPQVTGGKCYALHSSDREVHSNSTSGGFGYEIARWGIEHGYKVVGVAYDYATDQAKGIIVDRAEGLNRLQGSKYLQSNSYEAFSETIKLAKSNPAERFVCIGTPCQIYGLRSVIKRLRLSNDFIFIDLFCHGVPSQLVWGPYIAAMRKKVGNISNIDFRYKGNGWHQYSIRIEGEDGVYCNYAYNDTFYRYFFDNVALNKSCYDCYFRKGYSAADIRIGDFLGGAYEHRDDGISAVVAITERGTELVERLSRQGRVVVVGKHLASECLKSQSSGKYANERLREEVIKRLRSDDIHKVQRWYFKQLPPKQRLHIRVKSFATLLPTSIFTKLRRFARRRRYRE